MSDFPSTPRVNASLLTQHTGKTVRIIGKPLSTGGNLMPIQTSDNQTVKIKMDQCKTHIDTQHIYEFLGHSNTDLTVSAFRVTDFGSSFGTFVYSRLIIDLSLHDELVRLENGVLQDVLFA